MKPQKQRARAADARSRAHRGRAPETLYIPVADERDLRDFSISPRAEGTTAPAELPVPAPELMSYGESAERHLASGRMAVEAMTAALAESGFEWEGCRRVLEFGCANGRLLRWLAPHAEGREIWGTDIQAEKIVWAIENLSPPFHFATTTTVPHLPFPDRHFDLIFAGSVFTHIAELHTAWLLELTRILAAPGYLYITVVDERSIASVHETRQRREQQGKSADPGAGSQNATGLEKRIQRLPNSDEVLAGKFDFLSFSPYGNTMMSQVLIHSSYLRRITEPFLRVVGSFPEAYGRHQSAYVLRRPEA